MSLKENLLKKIQINQLADRVGRSLGSPDSNKKLDRQAMRALVEIDGFTHQKTRDLDLYVQHDGDEAKRILVLGNELAFFQTTVGDVAMRRSPTVREMISIRNAVKILNDKDIVISKGADTLEIIRQECLEDLDLTFNEGDLDEIAQDGIRSLANNYAEGVIEALILFAELTGYQEPPRELRIPHCRLFGRIQQTKAGDTRMGPLVIYGLMQNTLKFSDASVPVFEKDTVVFLKNVIKGTEAVLCEGPAVFSELKRRVMADS